MGIGLDLPGSIALTAFVVLSVWLVWRVPHLSPRRHTLAAKLLGGIVSAIKWIWEGLVDRRRY
jgi:hypothetical protein